MYCRSKCTCMSACVAHSRTVCVRQHAYAYMSASTPVSLYKTVECGIVSLLKVEVTSGLPAISPSQLGVSEQEEEVLTERQKAKQKQGKENKHNTCCVVGCCAPSFSFSLSPPGFRGQWDDMLKVGLHLASYLNRAATSQEHGSLPDCRLIKELLGWPSVPVGGQGSGLSLALPRSHCEALKRRMATETPLGPHNATYFPPKQKMSLMGFLFPFCLCLPLPFSNKCKLPCLLDKCSSGLSTHISQLSLKQIGTKICISQMLAAECNN